MSLIWKGSLMNMKIAVPCHIYVVWMMRSPWNYVEKDLNIKLDKVKKARQVSIIWDDKS